MADLTILSGADVQRLLQDPSAATRADMAGKIARSFGAGTLNGSERVLAEQIFRLMMRDAEAMVRKALAENLKDNPDLPRDVALTLAADVDDVAAPLLEFSSVLTEADLLEIVRSGAAGKQVSVARRDGVSEGLAHAIAREGEPEAVATLMANERATVPQDAFVAALDRFGDDENITGAMVRRSHLPVSVAERLVSLVSATLREHLVTHHELSPDIATDLIFQVRERATVDLSLTANRQSVPALVGRLRRNGRLTPTIILRALCTGDLDFFENAMAELAGIPVINAYRLIHDEGGQGLPRLVDHCGFTAEFLEIARTAVQVSKELQYDGTPGDRERFAERMIERVVTWFEGGFETENIDYLIGKLGREKTAGTPLTA